MLKIIIVILNVKQLNRAMKRNKSYSLCSPKTDANNVHEILVSP